ncbi:hypothetical protein [Nesterenkonia suensis]
MSDIYIQATLTRTAVNCGDHAQDMHSAIPVTEDTTLGELVSAGLATVFDSPSRGREVDVEAENYITIRVARSRDD